MEAMADTIPTAATGPKSNSVHHAFIRALLLSQTSDGYVSLCNAIVSARRPDYARIRCPVLVVAGEEDKTASLGDSKEIISRWVVLSFCFFSFHFNSFLFSRSFYLCPITSSSKTDSFQIRI